MTPLFDALAQYKDIKARFHMPSHGGAEFLPDDEGLFASALFDVTELSFSDNLSCSAGVIFEAEQLAAKAYGADRTLFFTGGATDALRTALLCVRDKKIAFLGDMHKSFHAAKRLFGLNVTDISSVEELDGSFGAVCVTSPDYYGRVKDVAAIAEACRKVGAKLIVDEAHGAHFAFSPLLPESAVAVADFVIHGAHKTLPVYTGGAMLHVKEAFYAKAREARAEVIGTSPSYLVMASLDYARDLLEREGRALYATLKAEIDKVKAAYLHVETLPTDDFSRVVIFRKEGGYALQAALEKGGVFVEAADADRVVLICTPFNVKYLKEAFRIADGFQGKNAKYADISDIIGKVSAYDVGVYPPGVPIVKAGEVFSEEKVKLLQANLDRLFGTIDGKIVTK